MTEKIWKLTSNTDVLHQDNWTDVVMKQLSVCISKQVLNIFIQITNILFIY